ncbi:MAG: AAA-like domain-containing protein [Leptolyngbyaceae cyanobacterium]
MRAPRERSPYQVGGSLPSTATTYVEREADETLFQALLAGKFCYVFDARQTGKSSLRVRTVARLQQAGVRGVEIDLTSIGTQQITVEQWYAALAASIVKGFELSIELRQWWRCRQHLPVVARLTELIDQVLLVEVQTPIVILLDEIDSITGLRFPTDELFELMRTFRDRRANSANYQRLTFALFGVATPFDLVVDKIRTPFEGGQVIALQGLTGARSQQLAQGLSAWVVNAEAVLQRILYWTGGQPFLTQKLCQYVVEAANHQPTELLMLSDAWVDALVEKRILENWEVQDEPEHLRTIRDRLWHQPYKIGQLLGLYQQVLAAERSPRACILVDNSVAQLGLLLLGIVEKRHRCLRVKNRIYRRVFNLEWVEQELNDLRPYVQAFDVWVESDFSDESLPDWLPAIVLG